MTNMTGQDSTCWYLAEGYVKCRGESELTRVMQSVSFAHLTLSHGVLGCRSKPSIKKYISRRLSGLVV